MQKKVGCGWIELNNQVHSFAAKDRADPERKNVTGKLLQLHPCPPDSLEPVISQTKDQYDSKLTKT